MYNQPYFIPGYYSSMAAPSMMRGAMNGASMLRGAGAAAGAGRGLGLFSRLGSSLSALRGLNWGGFINNASKTLGVINQAIPLVRQVGPMMNNVRSMLKVASVFKDETDKKPRYSNNQSSSNYRTNSLYSSTSNHSTVSNQQIHENRQSSSLTASSSTDSTLRKDLDDTSPTFFIES